MTIEISSELQPLLEDPSARSVLASIEKIVRSKNKKEQEDLLNQTIFCEIVNSALLNLDQRRDVEARNVMAAFHKENQPIADEMFIGRSN
ncbi:MAG: hypothetical protein P8Y06_00420 [Patescibacteria group bacterium]